MSIESMESDLTTVSTPPTPLEMRHALSHFASGVTVITGLSEDGPIGFCCQSFTSVSLEPPLILFCADHRGRAWPGIREAGRFTVNVLGDDQSEMCSRFGSSRGRKFEGLDWTRSRWGTPALPDVLARIHCNVETVHRAGDHDVAIGRVLGLEALTEERPMVFFRGGFGV